MYKEHFSKAPSASVLKHLKHDLMHALWELFLDQKFMHTYEHGSVVLCADQIRRRVFPRLLTYSADYPEK